MAQIIPEVIPHFRKPWQILVSVCLTRMNKITRELSDIEKRYSSMQNEIEFEESIYCDYEHTRRHLQEVASEKSRILSEEREKEVLDATRKLADIEDTEEQWSADLNKVFVASRNTECDELGNSNSLNRKLDNILHCVIKDTTLLLENSTLYPYTCLEPAETLRTASDRLLSSYSLKENAIFFSNAPVGVVKLRFDENEERGALYQGAKLFFMKAHLHKPPTTPVEDVEWLTLEELGECFNDGYFKRIQAFVS